MGRVTLKPGVRIDPIAPAGIRILLALKAVAKMMPSGDLVITSGSDGNHSGPHDPHFTGEAYDVRSHGFSPEAQQTILRTVLAALQEPNETVDEVAGGLATRRFWGILEAPGTPHEHFHIQRRNGTSYTIGDFLNS